jgi:chorismate synthase
MRYLTSGESHGKALVGILEGIPAGLNILKDEIEKELKRRKLGYGRGDRQKIESDHVEILSGVRFGKTLGSPISLLIENKDWVNWEKIMSSHPDDQTQDRAVLVPRPGHADLAGLQKYQFQDMRNVLERASARETTMRVAIGAIAKKFLAECGIKIYSRVVQIGSVQDPSDIVWSDSLQEKIDLSQVRMYSHEEKAIELIQKAQEQGDTLGGQIEVTAVGVPVGLGSYVHWDRKLDGLIAHAFMSLNAIKAVEIGFGSSSSQKSGSQVHDEIVIKENSKIGYATNRGGGINAGVSTGQPIIVRAAMKPLSTLKKPLQSVHIETQQPTAAHFERSDVCAVPSAAVIGESLLALVLAQEVLTKFGGDSMQEILPRIHAWNEK